MMSPPSGHEGHWPWRGDQKMLSQGLESLQDPGEDVDPNEVEVKNLN